MLVKSRRIIVSALILLGLVFSAGRVAGDVADQLTGTWIMDDGSPALIYPANEKSFIVLRVAPGKSTWADGYFFLKWPNVARPERGYYSLETGRVWITTYRWVNQQEQRVEYRGVVESDDQGNVFWRGTASTTGGGRVTWKFEAQRG